MIYKEKVVGHAVTACISCAFWNFRVLLIFFWFLLMCVVLFCSARLCYRHFQRLSWHSCFYGVTKNGHFKDFYRYHKIKFSVFNKANIKSIYMMGFFFLTFSIKVEFQTSPRFVCDLFGVFNTGVSVSDVFYPQWSSTLTRVNSEQLYDSQYTQCVLQYTAHIHVSRPQNHAAVWITVPLKLIQSL